MSKLQSHATLSSASEAPKEGLELPHSMRVVWIEDHQLIGDSLELLLQVVMPELTLDKARDLHSAQQLIRTFPYKLVLLDWWLGDVDGATSIAALREAGCEAPIVVVSGDEREPVLRRAQALGVAGYVRKSAEPQELIDTLRTVLQGGQTLPPAASNRVSQPVSDLQAAYPELTARQIDVFREMIRGSSDKQIARELGIGDTTVKSHVRAILSLLGVRSRGEAAHRARSDGAV